MSDKKLQKLYKFSVLLSTAPVTFFIAYAVYTGFKLYFVLAFMNLGFFLLIYFTELVCLYRLFRLDISGLKFGAVSRGLFLILTLKMVQDSPILLVAVLMSILFLVLPFLFGKQRQVFNQTTT